MNSNFVQRAIDESVVLFFIPLATHFLALVFEPYLLMSGKFDWDTRLENWKLHLMYTE